MLRISDLIENNAGLKTLIENSDSHKVELEELKSREKVKATVVHKHYQSKPLLVCAASCCVDIYKVSRIDLPFLLLIHGNQVLDKILTSLS